jgi:two-component system, LuxR family, response regulator FixJ
LVLASLLRSAGFATVKYGSTEAALDAAPGLSAGCILLDIWMPGMNGLELQARLNELNIPMAVIMMTGYGDVQTAGKR